MEFEVYDFKGPGIALAMYNVDEVCFVNYSRQYVTTDFVLLIISVKFD